MSMALRRYTRIRTQHALVAACIFGSFLPLYAAIHACRKKKVKNIVDNVEDENVYTGFVEIMRGCGDTLTYAPRVREVPHFL